jgi:hypothetical protein
MRYMDLHDITASRGDWAALSSLSMSILKSLVSSVCAQGGTT